MSSEALGYVWRRSPYKGTTFAVHLAIADSANDQHDYRFWMNQKTLASKVRATRHTVGLARSELEREGFLRRIRGGKDAGAAAEYRFVFKRHLPAVYEPSRVVDITSAEGGGKPSTPGKRTSRGARNPGTDPKNNPTGSSELDNLELVAASAAKASQTLNALRAGKRDELARGGVAS